MLLLIQPFDFEEKLDHQAVFLFQMKYRLGRHRGSGPDLYKHILGNTVRLPKEVESSHLLVLEDTLVSNITRPHSHICNVCKDLHLELFCQIE